MDVCKKDGCENTIKNGNKYCSKECYWIDKKGKPSNREYNKHSEETKIKISEKKKLQSKDPEYIKKLSNSHKGQRAWNRGKVYRKFKICKRGYCENLVQSYQNKYCSKECFLIDRSINNPMKKLEIREKVSESNKGKIAWNKGKTGIYSEETLIKIREARAKQVFSEESKIKRSESMKGLWENEEFRNKMIENGFFQKLDKHPHWQGGTSFEIYGLEFNKELKKYIKQRDMNICQTPDCMDTENLVIHHIDYNKKNSSLDNLITLCRSCHGKTNEKIKRSFYTQYYQEILTVYL